MFLLDKENEVNTDTEEIGEFPNAETLARYLSSLDKGGLWLYGVSEWDGDERVEECLRADEWLENFLKL